jgi:Tol biopolymer transport system component
MPSHRLQHRRRTIAVPLAGLLALGVAAAPASAAYSGRNGVIAFAKVSTDEYGNPLTSGIETVVPDGSGRGLIKTCPTGARCLDGEPAFAPGGRLLAFSSNAQTGSSLGVLRGTTFLYAAGSGTPNRFTKLTRSDTSPSWGPSGQRIAFTGTAPDGVRDVYTIGCFVCGVKRLTFLGGTQPAWGSNGLIAFTRSGNIYTMDEGGKRLKRVTGMGGSQPNWSPHATKLAFTRKGNVYLVGSDSKGLKRLTGRGGSQPAWSPDGKKIVFVRGADVYSVATDGSGLAKVATAGTGTTLSHPDWQPTR